MIPAHGLAPAPPGGAAVDEPAASLLRRLQEQARTALLRASAQSAVASAAEGLPGTAAEGGLIRPVLALAGCADECPEEEFWQAVLAVQLAHEASLVHDDVLDGADRRRGEATTVARVGVAGAILHGDHLLTAAYRAAAGSRSLAFATLFARAVERTVAAEARQGRATGRRLSAAEYEEIASGKAGELFGCALATAATLHGDPAASAHFELGRRIGLLYQRLDDLLDYCPGAGTGKPPLRDHAQHRWTWILEECPAASLEAPVDEVIDRLHDPADGCTPLERCLSRLEVEATGVADEAAGLPGAAVILALLEEWIGTARATVSAEAEAREQRRRRSDASILRERMPHLAQAEVFLASHSRSFRFATRFFPAADAARVSRVYAFCRTTDDLVDRPPEPTGVEDLLACWLDLARGAYAGTPSGMPLLDAVMREMAEGPVPFAYVEELVAGMRMDLHQERYRTLSELRLYTHRVAGVVGLWLTRLFGVHDPEVLERADRLGHAMQLTNILRDVGEDGSRGRIYLPAADMERYGVTAEALAEMSRGAPIISGYAELMEFMMGVAEADYEAAIDAIPMLPPAFARPVAVAAHVYRGIHEEIRRNGYDNLTRRAYTSTPRKTLLAASALWRLGRSRRTEGAGLRADLGESVGPQA